MKAERERNIIDLVFSDIKVSGHFLRVGMLKFCDPNTLKALRFQPMKAVDRNERCACTCESEKVAFAVSDIFRPIGPSWF